VNLQLTFLVGYSVLLIVLGLAIGRLVKTSGAFFVAGRQLGPVLLFSTLLAANIGSGSTVGAAGLGYRDGLSAWWWVGSAGIGSILLAFWVGPRMWRMAARHDLLTVGDFLELRYSSSVRGMVAALLWLGTLAILAGQLIAISTILNVVAGVPRFVGCLIGGAVMTTYFAAGGLLTSAWVNAVQLVVLLGGFAVALPMSLAAAGGWSAVLATEAAATPGYSSFWRGGSSGWIYVAMIVPAFIISPGLLQKIYGARDEKTVRVGVAANALVLLVFAFVPPLLGMIARVHHPELANHENALATLLVFELPLAVGTLGLAAVFSAEVSSCDAILFMLATSLSQDLYRRFLNPEASDAKVLKVARLAAVTGGVAGVGLAIVFPTVSSRSVSFCAHRRGASLSASRNPGSSRRDGGRGVDPSGRALGHGRTRVRRLDSGTHRAHRGGTRVCHRRLGPSWCVEAPQGGLMEDKLLFRLDGKNVAVVGGASGIGEAVALGCAQQGAYVACLDVNREGADSVASRIRGEGGQADSSQLDIRDRKAVRAALDEIREKRSHLDVVISTPSINVRKPILEYREEELERVLELNLKGNFHVLQAAGRIMAEQKSGSIVVFSSIRSLVVEPGQAVYAATKAGLVQMVRTLAAELGPSGVRVNALAPGVVETPLTVPIRSHPDWYRAYAEKSVLKRWARAEEMVGPTVFLASDAASYVTGTVLFVDGGWTAADGRFQPPGM
jgi:SSS family solute:Na+ symporter